MSLNTHYDTDTFTKREVKIHAEPSDTRGQAHEKS